MKIKQIEHIGIAVSSLQNSIKLYEEILGVQCYKIEEVKDQKVRTAFFKLGETKIELLESTDPEGPVSRFIEKKGEGVHHIAFAVGNLPGELNSLSAAGFNLIDASPRKGADDLDIAFIHPKSTNGVLIELCEKSSAIR